MSKPEITSNCHKLIGIKDITHDAPLTYLKLREIGCRRGKSMRFASRNRCRTDTTQKKFGPKGFQVFEKHKRQKNDGQLLIHKGWFIGKPKLDLGADYQLQWQEDPSDALNSTKMNKSIHKEINQKQENYKKYVMKINEYFKDITEPRFSHLGKKPRKLLEQAKTFCQNLEINRARSSSVGNSPGFLRKNTKESPTTLFVNRRKPLNRRSGLAVPSASQAITDQSKQRNSLT